MYWFNYRDPREDEEYEEYEREKKRSREEEEQEELQRRFREHDYTEEEKIDGWLVCHPGFKWRG